jgi:DNA gyrase subunit B
VEHGYHEGIHGYANGISTIEGGMHVEGFKTPHSPRWSTSTPGPKNLLKEKDENLLGEDIREGITAIVSVKLREPQFEGQTKAKLGNVPMRSLVQKATNEKLAEWLEENPTEANKIVKKAIMPSGPGRVAAKNARNAIRRKTALDGAGMPDKLKDCSSEATPRSASCSSWRATPPAARRSTRATRARRRSCRSAARSSTSSGPASTRC